MPPNGLTEKMLFKPKGHGHPKKIVRVIITHAVDATELFMNMMVPTKSRLASTVIIMVEMTIGAMHTEAIIEMRLVLASRKIGLDLRENLICRQTSCSTAHARFITISIQKEKGSLITS